MGKRDVQIKETISANREKLGRTKALQLAAAASEIIASRGKKVVRLKKADAPTQKEILEVMLGPTGNLRAPTLVVGKKVLVGFSAEVYPEVFP